MSRRVRTAGVLILLLAVVVPPGVRAAPAEDEEIRQGRRAAQQIEARFKVITTPAVAERVTRIGTAIAAVSDRPHLPYAFKVVEFDQVNAVALPGGFIYVTTGLLGFVRSDHELAAVLAHEIVHAAKSHGMEMARRANQALFITILVAIFTRDPAAAGGAAVVSGGVLSGYTRDLERVADLGSIAYLSRTPYSPVAVLTVLERLQRQEQLSGRPEAAPGSDHPSTRERVEYVVAELRARRIPINRRAPANYLTLTVREGAAAGQPWAEIVINERVVVRLADVARIREAADLLDRLFDAELEPFEVGVRETQGGWGIFARGWPVLRLTAQDVPPGAGTARDLAFAIYARLRAIMDEDLRRRKLQG
jgi:Zn-dependent protease with chaperone function